jgi:hypothetical protein
MPQQKVVVIIPPFIISHYLRQLKGEEWVKDFRPLLCVRGLFIFKILQLN